MQEVRDMNSMSFVKGMGAGLIVGACVGMSLCADKKTCKRKLGKTVKNIGEVIESVTDSLGL